MGEKYGICNLSVVPVRANPSDKAEILTQLVFGDVIEIIRSEEKWVEIRNLFDGYPGWIDRKQYALITAGEISNWDAKFVTGPGQGVQLVMPGQEHSLYLVPGSSVPVPSGEIFAIGSQEYVSPAGVRAPVAADFEAEVETFARSYLNAPYLWGGKSPFGIDCSGLTQSVFKMLGVRILRDAAQQGTQGEIIHFLSEAKTGDLAFFDNDEGRIVHVGILLGNSKIIHASGKVKIDTIDSQGIYSEEFQRHTHKLRIVRRYA